MDYAKLFVIIDPTRDEQPALARAAAVLRKSGGHIHAFCCVHKGVFSEDVSHGEGEQETRERAQEKLNALTRPLASDKITVEAEVAWNERWFECAVQACSRAGADLLLKSTYAHKHSSRMFPVRSDHYLLRHSPCPVLLTKAATEKPYGRVLAALALEDNDRKHETLNTHVVAEAQKICRSVGASLHAVAALEGTPNVAQILKISEDGDAEKLSGEYRISRHFGIDADRVTIDYGPAKAVIIETAAQAKADLVVMGTVGRSGISGAIIGNTCEKVVDELPIDVLAVQ